MSPSKKTSTASSRWSTAATRGRPTLLPLTPRQDDSLLIGSPPRPASKPDDTRRRAKVADGSARSPRRRSLVDEARDVTGASCRPGDWASDALLEVGPLHDLAARMIAKQRALKASEHRLSLKLGLSPTWQTASDVAGGGESVRSVDSAAVQRMVEGVAFANEDVREDLVRERLSHALVDNLMSSKKTANAGGVWSRRSLADVAKRAREIAGYRKQVRCLQTELDRCTLGKGRQMSKERKDKAQCAGERALEKTRYVQRFWDDYHEPTRFLDASPLRPEEFLRVRSDWDDELQMPETKQDFFKAVKEASPESREPMQHWRKGMAWEERALRDECTHFGWERAQQLRKFAGGGRQFCLPPACLNYPEQPSSDESDDSCSRTGTAESCKRRRDYRSWTPLFSAATTALPSCSSACGLPSLSDNSRCESIRGNDRPESSRASECVDQVTSQCNSNAHVCSDSPHSVSPQRFEQRQVENLHEMSGSSEKLFDAGLNSLCSDSFDSSWWNVSLSMDSADQCADRSITLPAMTHAFPEPKIYGPSRDSPTKVYQRTCSKRNCVPIVMPFMTGQLAKFAARGKALADRDLESICSLMPGVAELEEVDLEGNSLLTDKALMYFMRVLMKTPATKNLQRLCMRGCSGAGFEAVKAVSWLLTNTLGATNLRHLDVSGICISVGIYARLCKAIGAHKALHSVSLADTGFGNVCAASSAKECVAYLLVPNTLRILNMGWNYFTPEAFSYLGEGLARCGTITELHLRGCSAALHANTNALPIISFMEVLGKDTSLTRLDIGMNRINWSAVLVLEDALDAHPRLSFIDISDNPLGESGLRSFFRLLVRETSALTSCDIRGCCHGREPTKDEMSFSASTPFGRYVLDMSRSCDCAVLRLIYKTCERLGLKPGDVIVDVAATHGHYTQPRKSLDGSWPIHPRGKLSLTVNARKLMELSMADTLDASFATVLSRYAKLMKLRPSFMKAVPLLLQWQKMMSCPQDQHVLMKAISRDFLVEYPLAELLCSHSYMTAHAIRQFCLCVAGGSAPQFLTQLLTPTLPELAKIRRALAAFFNFNPDNPTGHYRLRLDEPSDFVLAEKLLLLNHWEGVHAQRQGRVDVSQRGNRSQFRNEHYQGYPLQVASYVDWRLPVVDWMILDYVTDRRPPKDVQALDQATWERIVVLVQASQCSPSSKVMSLRAVSSFFYVHAMQVRQMVAIITEQSARLDLFVLLFFRIVDIYHEKIARCKFSRDELRYLCFRLGFCALFPYIQPENWEIELDCSYSDQRIALNNFIVLASRERRANIVDYSFTYPNGKREAFNAGIPKTWEQCFALPKEGVFRGRYKCAPELRAVQARRSLLRIFSFWDMPPAMTSKDVLWWMGNSEAPKDAFFYLVFLVSRFSSISTAFTAIDGPGGNGALSFREFESSIADMGFKKFRTRRGGADDEKARIRAVFRYLDANADGKITLQEFSILQQMFREVELSVREFADFLKRTLGPDFEEAWNIIDADGSGDIDAAEWVQTCKTNGFFGDSMQVFHFIDKDGQGSISFDEFKELETFEQRTM